VPPQSTTPDAPPATPRYGRTTATRHADLFRQQRAAGTSQRQFARDHGLPRSTLQSWARRPEAGDADPDTAAFLASAAGLAFVHRLLTAARLVFCLQGPCGLRLLSAFLRLARLDRAAAASLGACHAAQVQLEQAVVTFAQGQRQQLAAGMAAREITVAEDETYHPACCLVALDADAGFLLVEKYAARRDQATWDAALAEGLDGLPVTVRQVVGDQAKGLVAHAEQGLGVPHSPDLFHAQHDVTKAVAPTLAARAREARRWRDQARANRDAARGAAAAGRPRGPGRPVDHAARVDQAEQLLGGTERHVATCEGHQEALRAAVRGLGEDDHPVDLSTGRRQGADAVRAKVDRRLAAVEQVAADAGAAAAAGPALAKVRRLVPGLVAAVAFFWARAEAAAVARFGKRSWRWAERLISGHYLRRVAGQVKGAQRRQQLRDVAERCLAAARDRAGGAAPGDWAAAERWGREVAGWFARSSSAVEGRNGQLALRYHSLHRLPERKLQALTAVHNFWVKRGDGTTAAERFFGAKPADLFEYLVEHLPVPARPAKRRLRAA
jgi:Family of unknown function (DUF6399)